MIQKNFFSRLPERHAESVVLLSGCVGNRIKNPLTILELSFGVVFAGTHSHFAAWNFFALTHDRSHIPSGCLSCEYFDNKNKQKWECMNSNTELFKQINLLAVHIEQMWCVVFSAQLLPYTFQHWLGWTCPIIYDSRSNVTIELPKCSSSFSYLIQWTHSERRMLGNFQMCDEIHEY